MPNDADWTNCGDASQGAWGVMTDKDRDGKYKDLNGYSSGLANEPRGGTIASTRPR